MNKPLSGFKDTFTQHSLNNLLLELEKHTVIVQPETAMDTKFGFFVQHPQNQHEVNHVMTEAQELISLLAITKDDEKNLFDRILANAEAVQATLDITTGDVLLDRHGNAQCINGDGQVKQQLAVSGFITNNQEVSVVFVYPNANTLVLVDFQTEAFTRITMIPKELIQ